MPDALAVSDTTFAEACALTSEPKVNVPEVIKKVAP